MSGQFQNTSLNSVLMYFYYWPYCIFFIIGAPLSIWEEVFAEMASQTLFPRENSVLDRWLFSECTSQFNCHAALPSVLLFIFLIILICYVIIPLFYHNSFNCFNPIGKITFARCLINVLSRQQDGAVFSFFANLNSV